jgi:fructose-1,6-bisphosphatase I
MNSRPNGTVRLDQLVKWGDRGKQAKYRGRPQRVLNVNAPHDVARVLGAIAEASLPLVHLIRRSRLAGALEAAIGPAHDGLAQKALDVFADEAFVNGLKGAGVRGVVSEERSDPVAIDAEGTLLVAIDPLDGSSNIEANISIGTFFSVLDAPAGELKAAQFLQPGVNQRAAGFVIYGPHVAFVFTTGAGVRIATLDPDSNRYRISSVGTQISRETTEFAINASNSRHWPDPMRAYIEDCVEGEEGPRGRNFNMCWFASTVAEVYRILAPGGVYLYPEDSRNGYENGRLRLLYEANPVAFLVEQAGGAAIDGFHRILDVKPTSIHARTPLIFGSKDKVERIGRYYSDGSAEQSAPLFAKRGLLRR